MCGNELGVRSGPRVSVVEDGYLAGSASFDGIRIFATPNDPKVFEVPKHKWKIGFVYH
jgi:hypothetical protein